MGKRKKSKDYDYLLKKVRRLEKSLRNRDSTPSSCDERVHSPPLERRGRSVDSKVTARVHVAPAPSDMPDNEDIPLSHSEETPDNESVTNNVMEPEIIEILGEDPSSQNTYGENLHKELLPRWKHILTNGLEKEVKVNLMKQYPLPENCSSLRAPKLNLEVKAAISDIIAKKEAYNENKQNQLSSCLAALVKALNIVLCSSEVVQHDIIKPLSDAGRLLCDYHYRESQSRRYSIINSLNKDIHDTVKNTKIYEFLFGADLSEQIKSAKAITKSGSELKRPPYKPPATGLAARSALNSRGARGATSSTRPVPSQRPPPPAHAAATPRGRDHHRYGPSSSRRSNNPRGRPTSR